MTVRPTLLITERVPRKCESSAHLLAWKRVMLERLLLWRRISCFPSNPTCIQVSEKWSGPPTQIRKVQGHLCWKENTRKEQIRACSGLELSGYLGNDCQLSSESQGPLRRPHFNRVNCSYKKLLQEASCSTFDLVIVSSVFSTSRWRDAAARVGLQAWGQHDDIWHLAGNQPFTDMFVCVLSCIQLFWNTMDCNPPGSSVYGTFPGENTGVGCHFLLQGIFLTQGSNSLLLHLLHWQADSLPLSQRANPNGNVC